MTFGEKIKSLRLERQWTQPELAERLAIEQSWLSKIENDKCLPSSELLDGFATVFNMPLLELLEDVDAEQLQKGLSSLPAVRDQLLENKNRLLLRSRRWMICAILLFALGASLFLAGAAELFFSDRLYVYESRGLVLDTEPEDLFERPDEFAELAVIAARQSAGTLSGVSGRDLEMSVQQKSLALSRRLETRQFLSADYLGPVERREGTTQIATPNLFDEVIDAGSAGTRVYYHVDDRPQQHVANALMIFAGLVMLLASPGLVLVEWRLRRLTSPSYSLAAA